MDPMKGYQHMLIDFCRYALKEHKFIAPDGKLASVSYSSSMDMEIIKEVFHAILSAAEVKHFFFGFPFLAAPSLPFKFAANNHDLKQVLGNTQDDVIQEARKAVERLRPIKIAGDGTVMEWVGDSQFRLHHQNMILQLCCITLVDCHYVDRHWISRILRCIIGIYRTCLACFRVIQLLWSKLLNSVKLQ